MFADQRDVSGDIEVIDEMGLDVLNQDTIKGYRIIFEQLHSPSAAACVVSGRSANGKTEWATADGVKLKDIK